MMVRVCGVTPFALLSFTALKATQKAKAHCFVLFFVCLFAVFLLLLFDLITSLKNNEVTEVKKQPSLQIK